MTDCAIRELDHGKPLARYARGWHCLGLAETFRDGRPHGINAFGARLVVFADSSGDVHVLDAYCRHMGADLSRGTIKGDTLACPFHDWRWQGSTGRCVEVPYAKRPPRMARTRRWPTCEVNGQLLMWHDPEGSTPPPELTPPTIEGMDEGRWSPWQWDSVLIEGANCREIIDNIVDMAHFFYIHRSYPTYFKNVIEGSCASQYMESRVRPDSPGADKRWEGTYLRSEATYFGPAYMINWLHNDLAPDFTAEIALINCHYPVTQDSFMLQWGVAVQQMPNLPAEKAAKLAAGMSRSFGAGFLEDVEIWKHKAPVENPLLTDDDGPVYQLRRWYEQFYVDAAAVTPDMTDRFEVEVDTSHAFGHWEAEVAENLAART
ncbi:Rieske 2Fe-2S domain-containing protein [[Mycobacterium] vasticus]|uniref:Rieske-type oxygenase n=1 Tax=[Mycobacterium] vasticus TaxID=2875777 RepID=A0ABU5Z051_9MYCO|nr:Rieske 2Fe-2S domain-containing protein [Mycolicibacter sp. MYC017]MEB3070758.1 Rieske 2Fe-2S domain-containing protein [Mycolicibacter sp. MYC017]